MIYYRIACHQTSSVWWHWQSTPLTGLSRVFSALRIYENTYPERIRLFFGSSIQILDIMLERENKGEVSNSVTLQQFLKQQRCVSIQAIKNLEMEIQTGTENDLPYHFVMPVSEEELRVWQRLRALVQRKVIVP